MFFHKSADINGILELIKPKLTCILSNCKWGIDVTITEHQKNRSLEQNKYMWAVYKHIFKFWEETGFIIDNLPLKKICSNFLHEYFKARFDLKTTTNLSTTEFIAYLDGIQQLMIEQTQGHYDPIYPEERFQTFN